MLTLTFLLFVAVGALVLAYVNAQGIAWAAAAAAALALSFATGALPPLANIVLATAFVIFALPLAIPRLRRRLISDGLFDGFRNVLPPMSQTEREAIEAGTVWWDGELFSGKPDWNRLLATPAPKLDAAEQHFLEHEVETLCGMVGDWETTSVYKDLPPHVWQYIRANGFLGMIIPKSYGGLGFSAYAHSQVITKLSTRCGAVAVSVLVPNSLGPGELLL